MGEKVNPHGARVGVIFGWTGSWHNSKRNVNGKRRRKFWQDDGPFYGIFVN